MSLCTGLSTSPVWCPSRTPGIRTMLRFLYVFLCLFLLPTFLFLLLLGGLSILLSTIIGSNYFKITLFPRPVFHEMSFWLSGTQSSRLSARFLIPFSRLTVDIPVIPARSLGGARRVEMLSSLYIPLLPMTINALASHYDLLFGTLSALILKIFFWTPMWIFGAWLPGVMAIGSLRFVPFVYPMTLCPMIRLK